MEMVDDGYKSITEIDQSLTVCQAMQALYADKYPMIAQKQADAMTMTPGVFAEGSFDAVIDKACLDSILCGYDSTPNAEAFLNEVHKVLTDTGVYISISYGTKERRMPHFQHKNFDWTVTTHQVAKQTINTAEVVIAENKDDQNFHWVYVMRKGAR